MLSYNRALTILSIILLLTLPQITHAKSVYVISDTETSHIQAYKVDDASKHINDPVASKHNQIVSIINIH